LYDAAVRRGELEHPTLAKPARVGHPKLDAVANKIGVAEATPK
jgi:hypothetical protein